MPDKKTGYRINKNNEPKIYSIIPIPPILNIEKSYSQAFLDALSEYSLIYFFHKLIPPISFYFTFIMVNRRNTEEPGEIADRIDQTVYDNP